MYDNPYVVSSHAGHFRTLSQQNALSKGEEMHVWVNPNPLYIHILCIRIAMHAWQPVRLLLSCGPFLDIAAAKRSLERDKKIDRTHTQKESIYTDLSLCK